MVESVIDVGNRFDTGQYAQAKDRILTHLSRAF